MINFVALLVAIILNIIVINQAFDLISKPSDAAVFAGLVILLLMFVANWLWLIPILRKLIYMLKKKMLLLLLCLFPLTSCGRTVVEPGHVGIKVNYYGEDRGVDSYPKVTGVVWYNPFTTSVFQYPTFVQTASWTHALTEGEPVNEEITFTTSDQMQVAADISLAYELKADKVPAFYIKFRSEDLKHFTHGFLRNLAREKFDSIAGKYRIDQIMGDNAPFLKEVRDALQKDIAQVGIILQQFGFIGAPRPPKSVIEAINAKVKATQQAIQVENELRRETAEAKKAIARAEGQARSNEIVTASITQQLLEWRRLELQVQTVNKWNGVLPQYMGGTSLPIPMLQIPKGQ